MLPLKVNNEIIEVNAKGLFKLEDLHKASGGKPTNRPVLFAESSVAQSLHLDLADYEFVNLDALYVYAKWVSSKFYMAFDHAFHAWENDQKKQNESFFKKIYSNNKAVPRVSAQTNEETVTSSTPLLQSLLEEFK